MVCSFLFLFFYFINGGVRYRTAVLNALIFCDIQGLKIVNPVLGNKETGNPAKAYAAIGSATSFAAIVSSLIMFAHTSLHKISPSSSRSHFAPVINSNKIKYRKIVVFVTTTTLGLFQLPKKAPSNKAIEGWY